MIKRVVVLILIVCLLCLSAVAQASTAPGTLVTITATASADGCKSTRTYTRLIVINPLFAGRTVYACGNWARMMPGIRVRWMQCVGKSYIPCEGITTNNGQILTEHGGLIKATRTAGRT